MEIRFVRPEEVRQLQRNVVTGFPSKTPQELLENMAGELVSPQEGRYLGCFDEDNTLIGSLLMMDFQQNIRGKLMNMGGIAYVSTGFLRKKEHIATYSQKYDPGSHRRFRRDRNLRRRTSSF